MIYRKIEYDLRNAVIPILLIEKGETFLEDITFLATFESGHFGFWEILKN